MFQIWEMPDKELVMGYIGMPVLNRPKADSIYTVLRYTLLTER